MDDSKKGNDSEKILDVPMSSLVASYSPQKKIPPPTERPRPNPQPQAPPPRDHLAGLETGSDNTYIA
jgi:hypothetical protein